MIDLSRVRHAEDCPWLLYCGDTCTCGLAAAKKALEAAERLTDDPCPDDCEPVHYDDNPRERSTYIFCERDMRDGHAPDCPWQALVAALRGEGVTA